MAEAYMRFIRDAAERKTRGAIHRLADLVLGALGLCAASQGTMNNLVFGNESFGYYETIGGGGYGGPGTE